MLHITSFISSLHAERVTKHLLSHSLCQTTVPSLTQGPVDVHDVLASAHLARVTRARFVALPVGVGRKPLGVVCEVRRIGAAAPALSRGLDTEVGGTVAVLLAELR